MKIPDVLKRIILAGLYSGLILMSNYCHGQENFSLIVQPSSISSVPGTHSGAVANWGGKWFFIGGRIDGLHIMQGNQAFPASGRNDSIFIVDPLADTSLAIDASQLDPGIYEAICSANMQFYQDGSHLYMIGGYGKEAVANIWKTFPSLISVDLNCLLTNTSLGNPISSCIRQYNDTLLAVTGGMLEKIDSTYYLVFGHRFDGRYSRNMPMSMFTQVYTHEIRKFRIYDDGNDLYIYNYSTLVDTNNFHRRDLNLVPQIYPDGEYGFTAFGGVFQKNSDMPFLTPVDIREDTVIHQAGFNQNLSQYTSAVMPLHDSAANVMHTVFFGGMSLYTLDTATGNLIQDTLIPFVNTISRITRDSAGTLSEHSFASGMPALIGTNSVFIPAASVPMIQERIIDLNSVSGVSLAGYITGGIESDFPNIADLDPEGMSRPHRVVYEVYIDKTINSVSDHPVNNMINDLSIFPNPTNTILNIGFTLNKEETCSIALYDARGRLIVDFLTATQLNGRQNFEFNTTDLKAGLYHCRIRAGETTRIVKLLVTEK